MDLHDAYLSGARKEENYKENRASFVNGGPYKYEDSSDFSKASIDLLNALRAPRN